MVLTGVDVLAPRPVNALVAMGDSITDGVGSGLDTDSRWSDALSDRLARRGGAATMAVLNAGISRNELLADRGQVGGESPLVRVGREVAELPGATDVVLHIGTNDIAAGRSGPEIVDGLVRFAGLARAAGKRVFLTTITPSDAGPHGTAHAAAAVRDEVNRWVRERGPEHADGVFDFAAAVADPARPTRLRDRYDSGDGLAPVRGRLPGARGRRRRHPDQRKPVPGRQQPGAGRALRARLTTYWALAAEPAQRVAPGRGLDVDGDRQRAGLGVLLVEPFEDPVDGQRAGGDAAGGGEAAQLLHAQCRQPQREHLGRPEPPGGGACGGGLRCERGQVGVELGIVRRQLGLHAGLALGRDAVPCAPSVVTGSHRRSVRPPPE